MKKVHLWTLAIVKMKHIVITIDDHVDKLRLQRKNNKPNAKLAEGKITLLKVNLTMITKGACVYMSVLFGCQYVIVSGCFLCK